MAKRRVLRDTVAWHPRIEGGRMLRGMKPSCCAILLALAGSGSGLRGSVLEPATASQLSQAQARHLLEAAYAENRRAHLAKDIDAVLHQRTPDFQAILPDGRIVTAAQQAEASRNLLANVEWVALTLDLGEVRIAANELSVDVTQHSIRRQMRDGALREIENWVVQAETWVRTPDGLRIRRVDNIRDQCVRIDGRIRQGIDPAACERHGVSGG
jgi:ketosteroid isomerase-like protein